MLHCNYTNVQELARAVAESASLMDRTLTPRPHNQFEPERSDWYLVPSTDWPAHRYGKAMLRATDRPWSTADMLACLIVEKGFAPKTAGAEPRVERRGLVIDPEWTWYAFLQALAAGAVTAAAQEVVAATGEPVLVEICEYELQTVIERSKPDKVKTTVRFRVDSDGCEPLDNSGATGLLRGLLHCQNLEEIPNALRQIDLDWHWIDFFVGIELSRADVKTESEQGWSAAELWKGALRPWLPWIH